VLNTKWRFFLPADEIAAPHASPQLPVFRAMPRKTHRGCASIGVLSKPDRRAPRFAAITGFPRNASQIHRGCASIGVLSKPDRRALL
jgi:hypothetical protein